MVDDRINGAPVQIADLAARCLTHVKHRIGMNIDFQVETLGVVDCFMQELLKDEGGGVVPPPGNERRAYLIHLLGPTIGAYFGEVVRGSFPCRWRVRTENPADWLLEFDVVPLRFNPVGAAVEALAGQKLDHWNGALATERGEIDSLFERLSIAPPVPEDELFALTTRLEVLQIAQEWLQARRMTGANGEPEIRYYSPEYYDRVFDYS
jgi:hypothetical protein